MPPVFFAPWEDPNFANFDVFRRGRDFSGFDFNNDVFKNTLRDRGFDRPNVPWVDFYRAFRLDPSVGALHNQGTNPENYLGAAYLRYLGLFPSTGGGTGDGVTRGLPDPTPFFDPAGLNRFFDISRGNLSAAQGQAGASAARRAGAMAGGFLNPQSFVSGAATQATVPFASAFGNLEGQRAQGQQTLKQGLFQALMARELAERGSEDAARQYELALQQLAQQRDFFNRNLQQQQAGTFDYLGLLTGLLGRLFGRG